MDLPAVIRFKSHFFSEKEYLATDTSTKSPGILATPAPGLSSSMRSLGLNTSGPSLNLNSGLLGIWMLLIPVLSLEEKDICAENPSREKGKRILITTLPQCCLAFDRSSITSEVFECVIPLFEQNDHGIRL